MCVCMCAHMCITSKSSSEYQGHPYSDTYNFSPIWPSFDSPHESWITGNPRPSSLPEHPFLFLFIHSVFWDVVSLGFFLLKYHLLLKSQPRIYLHLVFFRFCLFVFFDFQVQTFSSFLSLSGFVWAEIQNKECGSLTYHKRRAVSWKVAPFLELLKA